MKTMHKVLWALGLAMLWPMGAQAHDTQQPIGSSEGGSRVVAVSAGASHSCALKADGAVDCWGYGGTGQAEDQAGPYLSVSANASHSCGVKADGAVNCWGYGGSGQAEDQAGPYLSVSAGYTHSCGVKANGAVDCWGEDYFGEAEDQPGPYLSVSAGVYLSCGVKANGAVDCWGYNAYGQAEDQPGPYLSVSAGYTHSCGVKANGAVDCWGDNGYGQAADQPGPYLSVSAGAYYSCGVKTDGAVHCWGKNDYGQAADQPGPYLSVSAGRVHSCGVKADGTVACWGAGGPGSSGAPHYGQSTVPATLQTAGATAFGQIAAGNAHACDLQRDGSIHCWGANDEGQANAPAGTFTQVVAGDSHSCALGTNGKVTCWGRNAAGNNARFANGIYRKLAVGSSGYSCAMSMTVGIVDCYYPYFSGQLAQPGPNFYDISMTGSLLCGVDHPALAFCLQGANHVGFLSRSGGPWAKVEAGLNHACGLKADGTITCGGDNAEGQTSNVPTGQFRALSVGYNHACAIRDDGQLACWGSNASGQTDAPAGTYVQVAAGNTFTCAIRSDGVRVCWGGAPGNPASLSNLPGGTVGVAYSQQIVVSGPSAPANPVFVHMAGTLPPGLSLTPAGVLAGTPTSIGTFTFTIDAEGDGGFAATRTYTLTIIDITPPQIGYTLTPAAPDGSNGWYVSDIGIDWTVSDAESSVSGIIGCVDETLNTDTTGTTRSCTASSLGGSASLTTEVLKRDATAPTITATESSTPDGNNGWYRSNATVHFTCNDNLSGVASCPADQVLSSDGSAVSSAAQTAQDVAGNTSAASNVVTVKIDKTAPTLAPTTPDPLLRGQSYVASPNASDATSGIASSSCGALDTSSLGSKSTTCSATDNAGNGSTVTLHYTVTTTCANDGYSSTQLQWCVQICESGLTGKPLEDWIKRWFTRYRNYPYCVAP